MKKRPSQTFILGILAALVCCIGCADVQRGVMNKRLFYSSEPPLEILVAPDMVYRGAERSRKVVMSVDGYTRLDLHLEGHCFASIRGNEIKRGVTVIIKNISSSFLPDIYRNEKRILEKGVEDHQRESYEYIVSVVKNDSSDTLASLLPEGYTLPDCYLMRAMGRRYGADDNYVLDIRYVEPFDDETGTCGAWFSAENSSAAQQEYLRQFISRFRDSVRVLK